MYSEGFESVPTYLYGVVPDGFVSGLVVDKNGPVVLALESCHSAVQTFCTLVEEHLSQD